MAKPRASANRLKGFKKAKSAPQKRVGLKPMMPAPGMMQPPPVLPPGPPPGQKEDTNATPPHAKI